jgi:hypothetical protein
MHQHEGETMVLEDGVSTSADDGDYLDASSRFPYSFIGYNRDRFIQNMLDNKEMEDESEDIKDGYTPEKDGDPEDKTSSDIEDDTETGENEAPQENLRPIWDEVEVNYNFPAPFPALDPYRIHQFREQVYRRQLLQHQFQEEVYRRQRLRDLFHQPFPYPEMDPRLIHQADPYSHFPMEFPEVYPDQFPPYDPNFLPPVNPYGAYGDPEFPDIYHPNFSPPSELPPLEPIWNHPHLEPREYPDIPNDEDEEDFGEDDFDEEDEDEGDYDEEEEAVLEDLITKTKLANHIRHLLSETDFDPYPLF